VRVRRHELVYIRSSPLVPSRSAIRSPLLEIVKRMQLENGKYRWYWNKFQVDDGHIYVNYECPLLVDFGPPGGIHRDKGRQQCNGSLECLTRPPQSETLDRVDTVGHTWLFCLNCLGVTETVCSKQSGVPRLTGYQQFAVAVAAIVTRRYLRHSVRRRLR
jgi:hypothetical protein